MTTARRTGTNETISTYGAAGLGRDYTSLCAWEIATDNDLVTLAKSEVLECYDDVASFDDNVFVGNAITDNTHFRIIRPASGQGHDGTTNNGVYFLHTRKNNIFELGEQYAKVQDLILTLSVGTTKFLHTVKVVSSNVQVVGCLSFDSTNTSTGAARAPRINSANAIVALCLADNNENGFWNSPGAGNTAYWYNCTAVSNGNRGWRNTSGTAICRNCLGSGNGVDDFQTGTYTGSNNNASGDTTAPGTSSRTSQTFTFVDTVGNNFHLASGDAGAKDFGVDLSADGTFAFDDDIDGDLFNVWDIGFDENTPAGGVSIILAGNIPGLSTLTGLAGLNSPVSGTAIGTSGVSGILGGPRKLIGTVIGGSFISGLTGLRRPLIGTSPGLSVTSGTVGVLRSILGNTVGQSTLTGIVKMTRGLSGISGGISTLIGMAKVSGPLSGIIIGVSGALGILGGPRKLIGTIVSNSSVSGLAGRRRPFIGTILGSSTVSGALGVLRAILGSVIGQSTLTGIIKMTRGLFGTSTGVSIGSGALSILYKLAGSIPGISTAIGTLSGIAITVVGTLLSRRRRRK